MGEKITAKTQRLLELCKYKVGQVPELVKYFPRGGKTGHQGKGE
jgi:hypothetical protein